MQIQHVVCNYNQAISLFISVSCFLEWFRMLNVFYTTTSTMCQQYYGTNDWWSRNSDCPEKINRSIYDFRIKRCSVRVYSHLHSGRSSVMLFMYLLTYTCTSDKHNILILCHLKMPGTTGVIRKAETAFILPEPLISLDVYQWGSCC